MMNTHTHASILCSLCSSTSQKHGCRKTVQKAVLPGTSAGCAKEPGCKLWHKYMIWTILYCTIYPISRIGFPHYRELHSCCCWYCFAFGFWLFLLLDKVMEFSKDGLYLALAERRDCKDFISIFDCNVWQLCKVGWCVVLLLFIAWSRIEYRCFVLIVCRGQ